MNAMSIPGVRGICFLLVGVVLISCSKKGGTDVDDGNNPYVILDLHVTSTSDSTITLGWTATGDDADQGTCSRYDMRICTDPISVSNWESIYQVTGEPHPSAAGLPDSMTVHGLKKDSTYFFALMAFDEANNSSGLSNCVSGVCIDNFAYAFPDPHLEAAMRATLGITSGDIHRLDLEPLEFFAANDDSISDLTGMEYCPNLTVLFLNGNQITDLSPLGSLARLTEVQFVHDSLAVIPSLAGWTSVTRLFVTDNRITDISGLEGMTNLHHLYAGNNLITDLSALLNNNTFAAGDTAWLTNNPLTPFAIGTQIPGMEARGATIIH